MSFSRISAGKRFLGSLLLILAATAPLMAQTSITSNDGGTSTTGNLYEAVTTINGIANGGSVTLAISGSNSVTLAQTLPAFSQSVTFLGNGTGQTLGIFAQSEAEGSFAFTQNLTLGNEVALGLSNAATGGNGFSDSFVSVGGTLSMGVSASGQVNGASGIAATGTTGLAGGNAGSGGLGAAGLSLTGDGAILAVHGGNGSSGGGNSGSGVGGNGGTGGDAAATVDGTSLSGTGDQFNVVGGNGGSGGAGGTSGNGGNGGAAGNATATAGNVSLSGLAEQFAVTGGGGGNGGNGGSVRIGGNGGAGGNSAVTADGIFLSDTGDEFNVIGGGGGRIVLAGGGSGAGGDAAVTAGTIALSGPSAGFNVTGGAGGGVGGGGNAGDAQAAAGNIALSGAGDQFDLNGGLGGDGGAGGNSGNGGGAQAAAESITLSGAGDGFNVTGGKGGNNDGINNPAAIGGGAQAAAGSIALSGIADRFNVTAGNGNVGASGDVGSAGGTGGVGGDAAVTAGNIALSGMEGQFNATGGNGGSGGQGSNGVGGGQSGNGGAGGSAAVAAESIALSGLEDQFNLAGGGGGANPANFNNGYGGVGGTAGVTAGSIALSGTGDHFNIAGGAGGTGASFDGLGAGNAANGGSGGNAAVTAGSIALSGTGDQFSLTGGTGGTDASGFNSNGGNGGNAAVSASSLYLGDGTNFTAAGGPGGAGTGGTNGTAGSAYVGLGSLVGSGAISLWGSNADLTVDSGNFSGVINGNGGLVVSGPFILNGSDSSTGPASVQAGGLLAGTGFVASTLTNNGTLQPGNNGTGIFAVAHYVQTASGILAVGISDGHSTALAVVGTANLAGTLEVLPYGGFVARDNESVTILDASSISGTFATVTDEVPKSPVSVVYDPDAVVLDITATLPSFFSLGSTANQRHIGSALDHLAGLSPGSNLVVVLNNQPNSVLPGLYDEISPAGLTPLYQVGFATAQAEAGLVGNHISQLFGDLGFNSNDTAWNGQGAMFAADMPAAQEASISKDLEPQRWGVFVNGLGNFGTVTSDGNGPGYQYSTGGTAVGLDYRFSKDFVGGLLLGYSSSGTSQSTGTVNSTGGQAGLYAGWKQESLYIEALAAGGVNNYTTQRQALGGTASGSTQGTQFSGQLEAGYDWKAGDVKIQPFVSGEYTNVGMNAFSETGSLAPLSFGAQNEGYLSSDLGASAAKKFNMGGWSLSPRVTVAWEHVYEGSLDSLSANIASGTDFTVNGPAMGADAAVLGAGVNAAFAKGMNAYVQYQGKVGQTSYTEQNVSGGVNVGF